MEQWIPHKRPLNKHKVGEKSTIQHLWLSTCRNILCDHWGGNKNETEKLWDLKNKKETLQCHTLIGSLSDKLAGFLLPRNIRLMWAWLIYWKKILDQCKKIWVTIFSFLMETRLKEVYEVTSSVEEVLRKSHPCEYLIGAYSRSQ